MPATGYDGALAGKDDVQLVREVAQLSVDAKRSGDRRTRAYSDAELSKPDIAEFDEKQLPASTAEFPASVTTRKEWLAQADPAILSFDIDAWRAEMHVYIDARQRAELCAAQAREEQLRALDFAKESAWLLRELQDVVDHELQRFTDFVTRQESVVARRELASAIRNSLDIGFLCYDRIERVLRGPAPKAVPHLEQMVNEIDRGLEFFKTHPDFVGAQSMISQWEALRTRALAIAGAYIQHTMRKLAHASADKVQEAKFRAGMQPLHPLIAFVRTDEHDSNAWLDLQRTYCELRVPAVSPTAQKYADELLPYNEINEEFLTAARTALAQCRQLCEHETQLFEAIMGPPTETFKGWLGDVVLPLYAAVRRLLVHEHDMSRLCELALVVSPSDDTVSDPVSALLATAAQSRIAFRAQLEIDALGRYTPVAADFKRTRFPTVERALKLLSQVYALLPTTVFNELAHKCVVEVLRGLDAAVAGANTISRCLFHIRQLLLLQSQIADFDIHERTLVHEIDFSGMRRLLLAARQGGTRSFRELLALAWDSIPRVVDIMVDAMEDIFGALRQAVEHLCLVFTNSVFENTPLKHIRDSIADGFKSLREDIQVFNADIEFSHFLLDSAMEAVLDRYTAEYRRLGNPEDALDIDAMAAWVSTVARE